MTRELRELTPQETEFVAGGQDGWEDSNGNGYYDSGDTIVVTGYRVTTSGGGGGGGGGLGEPGADSPTLTPTGGDELLPAAEPLPTPCVETTFATPGVNLTDANRAALAASNVIAGLNSDDWEYSAIVFFHDGKVGFTEPYTENSYDGVNLLGSIGHVPNGAIILGIVHNHPDDSMTNDSYPSQLDWSGYNQIQNLSSSGGLPRGITADSNMLFYILSDEDNKTRVYDKTDKHSERAACALQ